MYYDEGFTIKDYLSSLGVQLVIPSFLKGQEPFTEEEVIKSQQIANERIHIERMIQRLNYFAKFDRVMFPKFDRVIPLQMIGSLNQIITYSVFLCNYQEPIIKGV